MKALILTMSFLFSSSVMAKDIYWFAARNLKPTKCTRALPEKKQSLITYFQSVAINSGMPNCETKDNKTVCAKNANSMVLMFFNTKKECEEMTRKLNLL